LTTEAAKEEMVGIENVATLDGRGHVQVMFDQKVHFGGIFLGKLQAGGGARESFEASAT